MANVSSSNSQKALVPKLRFPGFDGEWQSVKLSEKSCYQHSRGQDSKSRFISTENMKQNCSGIVEYDDSAVAEGICFSPNDILLANIRPYLKKAWKASFAGICSADVLAIHPNGIDPSFLFSVISRDSFFSYVMSGVKGSKMPRGDKGHIMDYPFAVPSLVEQAKISEFIILLDKRIDAQRRTIDSLKLYKRGVVKHLLTAKPSDGWISGKIGNLGSFHKGASLSKADIHTDGRPMILYGELYTTYSEVISTVVRKTQATVDEVFLSRIGDVIMPTSGETPEEISTASCVMIPGVVLAGDLLIYRSTEVDGRIMSYALNHVINDRVARIAQGKSVVHVQSSEIGNIEITLPPLELQVEYANFLDHLSAIISAEQRCSEELLMLKASLLQQMFI